TAHGGQYQPSIVTRRDEDDVGITFYQRVTNDPKDLRIDLQVARSTDAVSFSRPRAAHPEPWVPCPDAYGPNFAPHRYGDYVGSIALVDDRGGPPTFVTAHPISTACKLDSAIT